MPVLRALKKINHYRKGLLAMAAPNRWHLARKNRLLSIWSSLSDADKQDVMRRVDYYCQLSDGAPNISDGCRIGDLTRKGKQSLYYVDFIQIMTLFDADLNMQYEFGDVVHVPDTPCFVKSRPICESNQNAVLLKLNSFRHYYTEKDSHSLDHKQPTLVWRGAAHQPHRVEFLEHFSHRADWDVGCTSERSLGKPYHKNPLSIQEQLKHQFILSIEGYDVATNLKWIMASHSVCVMRKPRFETWYMEQTLIPDHHYILVKDDYSDMDEKLAYYTQHPEKVKAIVRNANAYFKQFKDTQREQLIGFLVADKYFRCTR